MNDPDRFDPAAFKTFRVLDRSFDEATRAASLHYAFDEGPSFVETVTFETATGSSVPVDRSELDGALLNVANKLLSLQDHHRALPDADLDAFVEALATRIAKFDKWAIAQTKRLVNTSLPPDVELGAGWDACIASLGRSAAQEGIKALMARGFHKPGDVENRLGYYLGQIAR